MNEPDPPDAPPTVPSSAREAELSTAHDAAFTAFYHATTKRLVAFLMLQGAALADATDIIQDTMALATGAGATSTIPAPGPTASRHAP